MYKIKMLFILMFWFQNIFCMNNPTYMETFVEQPFLVACLSNKQVFIGGENGFEIVDSTDNTSIMQRIFSPHDQQFLYDIAVNKEKTQYAVSLFGKIECYNAADHTLLWTQHHNQTEYVPVTFDSQNENRVIFCLQDTSISRLYPTCRKDRLLYFYTATKGPISCHPSKTEALMAHLEELVFTDHNKVCHKPCSVFTLEARYASDGKHIVNTGNTLNIYSENMEYDTITIDSFCIAFECYNNSTVAILTRKNTLLYYDYFAKKLLAQTMLKHLKETTIDHSYKRLSFSSDGTKSIIALRDNCFVLPVPFTVLFGPKKAETLFSTFCLLEPYSNC